MIFVICAVLGQHKNEIYYDLITSDRSAKSILDLGKASHRDKRENSGVYEELQPASFERECREQRCNDSEFNEAMAVLEKKRSSQIKNFKVEYSA